MRWVWWVLSVIVVGVVGWQIGTRQEWLDFYKGYYFGGHQALLDINQLYPAENCPGFVNFPLLAYLFAPFGLLPQQEAGRLFFVLNLISIIPLAYWLVRFGNLTGWKRWFMLILLGMNGPLDYSLWLGNMTQWIMLSLLILLWWYERGREWLTGVLLGINGLLKIPLILPAGYFLVRRRWRVVAGGLMVAFLAVGVSLLFIPFSLNRTWFDQCILPFSGHPVAAYNNQSVMGFLARRLIPESDINYWFPLEPTRMFTLVSNISTILLYMPVVTILLLGWKSSRTASEHVFEFLIVLTCSLLTSPLSWTHYFMLLLLPVAYYLGANDFDLRRLWFSVPLAIGLVFISIPIELTVALSYAADRRLFLSMHFMGGVLLYVTLVAFWFHRRNRNPLERLEAR